LQGVGEVQEKQNGQEGGNDCQPCIHTYGSSTQSLFRKSN
jgi:hypothetical protein